MVRQQSWMFHFRKGTLPRAAFLAAFLATLVLGFSSRAHAVTLEIQVAGLDLHYDGSSLFDNAVFNTVRTGDPLDAAPLDTMNFLVNGALVGSLNSDIYADIYIAGLGGMPDTGGLINSTGNGGAFGIDLFTSSTAPAWGLALDVDVIQFSYLQVAGFPIAITAGGLASDIFTQQLPFGLEFDPNEPVTIVISSAQLSNVTTGGGLLTGLDASGTGNVAGTLVPEPGSATLLAIGCAAAAYFGVRHRRRA